MANLTETTAQPTTPATASGGLVAEFRRQLVAAIFAGLIAGFIAALGAMWTYLQSFVGSFALVPKDAVVAFAGKCPSRGWDDYTDGVGKFIVGAGRVAS